MKSHACKLLAVLFFVAVAIACTIAVVRMYDGGPRQQACPPNPARAGECFR